MKLKPVFFEKTKKSRVTQAALDDMFNFKDLSQNLNLLCVVSLSNDRDRIAELNVIEINNFAA